MFVVALTELIETRPGVRSGKPCFVGTRITVDDVLEYVAAGMTAEAIVADFPELTVELVDAVSVSDGRRRGLQGGSPEGRHRLR